MKRWVFLLAAFFTLSAALAQEDEKIKPLFSLQQMFLYDNFIADRQKINIEAVDQVDSLFSVVESSWKRYADDSIDSELYSDIPKEIRYNVDAYSYMWLLYSITGKTRYPENIDHHLLKKYMLPSLLTYLDALKKDIALQSYRLIGIGSLHNTLDKGGNYYEDKEVIDRLYGLMIELEELLKKFSINADEETAKDNLRLIRLLKNYAYDIKAKYYFANRQEDKAFEYFITGVSTNQYPILSIFSFSKVLIDYFSESGKQDKAFALLNNIIFSTGSDEVSRDSLATWYYAVDSVRGAELYKRASQKLGGSFLSISEVTLKPNPTEWNYITNGLPNDKLQKAEYILIDFWNTSCKPCLEEIPELNELHDILKKRDDIVFISINTDHFETKRNEEFVSENIKKHHIRFPVVFDDDSIRISQELNIKAYPTKMIVNSRGRVLEKVNGSHITLSTFNELLSSKN